MSNASGDEDVAGEPESQTATPASPEQHDQPSILRQFSFHRGNCTHYISVYQKKLGPGAQGSVYMAMMETTAPRRKPQKRRVAVKFIESQDTSIFTDITFTARHIRSRIGTKLRSTPLDVTVTTANELAVILPLLKGVSANDVRVTSLLKMNTHDSIDQLTSKAMIILDIGTNIASHLTTLHLEDVVHGDPHAGNYFRSRYTETCLIDFDLGRVALRDREGKDIVFDALRQRDWIRFAQAMMELITGIFGRNEWNERRKYFQALKGNASCCPALSCLFSVVEYVLSNAAKRESQDLLNFILSKASDLPPFEPTTDALVKAIDSIEAENIPRKRKRSDISREECVIAEDERPKKILRLDDSDTDAVPCHLIDYKRHLSAIKSLWGAHFKKRIWTPAQDWIARGVFFAYHSQSATLNRFIGRVNYLKMQITVSAVQLNPTDAAPADALDASGNLLKCEVTHRLVKQALIDSGSLVIAS